MSDKTAAFKETETFVKNVLRDRFHQKADAATVRAVAEKVMRTFPSSKARHLPRYRGRSDRKALYPV